ncbi:hypothetical protein AVEN_88926-1 [Araneus ventricosus]|uniref:Uncharacterized protein n=1 Tax=Araneus ventricosus TaxID=182803 RepID=A0A4Y2WYH0_ARAVE|nr:hypothetical protein AVEN_88926-1 [Araneus ventricosus]
MMRALWDFAVYCWRSLQVFWARIRSSEQAPTVENIAAFEGQPTESGDERILRRQYSLQAHQGSVSSSMQDSTISGRSPTIDAFSSPETVSQASRSSVPSSGEQDETGSEQMPRSVQSDKAQQDTPLLHRRESQRSLEQPIVAFEGTSSQVSDSSEKSYNTF